MKTVGTEKVEIVDRTSGESLMGYYNVEDNHFYLEQGSEKEGNLVQLKKPSEEIGTDLYDPFAELKFMLSNHEITRKIK